jgi:3-oxoacyl-[acyl-carrier protein] reductase
MELEHAHGPGAQDPTEGGEPRTAARARRIPESLRGLRALVTGSATGIGRHIGLALARAGVHVAFNYKTSRAAAEAAAAEARRLGVQAVALQADCADARQVRALVAAAAEALGGLEILVNNVGEFAWKPLREHTVEEFERILAGTAGATFHATVAALPYMRRAGFGRVVNLGAAGADHAIGGRNEGPHLAGKAAVVSLTRSFALEEAWYGVTFNVVNPGIIEQRDLPRSEALRLRDRSNPVGRPGTSEDIVDAVLFLCRPESSFINGASLTVSGGWQGYLE